MGTPRGPAGGELRATDGATCGVGLGGRGRLGSWLARVLRRRGGFPQGFALALEEGVPAAPTQLALCLPAALERFADQTALELRVVTGQEATSTGRPAAAAFAVV